jgi:hypothetical protein
MKINLNENIQVNLDQKGIEIWEKEHPRNKGKRKTILYRGGKFQSYTIETQLWIFIKTFGPHIEPATPGLFYPNEIEVIK